MTDGLSIIDLTDNTVYTYESSPPPDGGTYNGVTLDPTLPVGREPDSAAADPTTGVIVIPSEGDSFQSVIDLSRATFDKATKTVTAPQSVIPNLYLDAVAVEPNKNLAFWEPAFYSDIAVADLTQANLGGTASVYATMPGVPGGASFSNIGDPHGIAVTTALTSGGPVGFVVDSQLQWIARIDLAGMLAAGAPDASSTLSNAMVAPYVTFLDALTPEHGGDAGSDGGSDAGGQ